ncbi:Maf family protein, partial [uncultured Muribaculum sp.]
MQSPLHNLSRYDIRLASKSPRRRELLGMLGLQFSIAETIDVDESYPHDLPTNEVAPYIAKKKGDAYRKTLRE